MYTTVSMEAGFFVASMAAGIVVAFLYDLIRISRRVAGLCDAVVNFQDIIFFVAAAAILFYAAYLKNSGEIRWQGFIGCGLGIGAYVIVVKNRLLNVSTLIIKWLVRIAEKVMKIVLFPVKLVFKIFKKPISVIAWYTGNGVRRAGRFAKRSKERLGIRLKSAVFCLKKK